MAGKSIQTLSYQSHGDLSSCMRSVLNEQSHEAPIYMLVDAHYQGKIWWNNIEGNMCVLYELAFLPTYSKADIRASGLMESLLSHIARIHAGFLILC